MRFGLLLLLIATSSVAAASDEDWLSNFAKRSNGRFVSELKDLPKLVTVRYKPGAGGGSMQVMTKTYRG